MKNYKKIISNIFAGVITYILPVVTFAQIKNPLKGATSVGGFVTVILGYVVRIGGIVAIFAFIYVGYLFVKAKGNPGDLEKAKTTFFNTVIGVAILLGAQIISTIITGTINSLQ